MIFYPLDLNGAYQIGLTPGGDERGQFTRLVCMNELASIGHVKSIVQVNHSLTRIAGTVRGMHFQYPPRAEIKMVTCLRGRVFDVLVDLRKGSPTFLEWRGFELTDENNCMMYIPAGFAHGFQALEKVCELIYFHTEFYSPEAEGGIRYDDEALRIAWPAKVTHVSPRDLAHKRLSVDEFKGIVS